MKTLFTIWAISITNLMYAQFSSPINLTVGSNQIQELLKHKVFDLDEDGKADIVQLDSDKIRWQKNLGNGNFQYWQEILIPDLTSNAIFAPMNPFGRFDIVYHDGKIVYVVKNLGNSTFSQKKLIASIPDSLQYLSFSEYNSNVGFGDINKDGKTDLYLTGLYMQPCIVPTLFFQILSQQNGTFNMVFASPFEYFGSDNNFSKVSKESYFLNNQLDLMFIADKQAYRITNDSNLYAPIALPAAQVGWQNQVVGIGNLVGDPLPDLLIRIGENMSNSYKLAILKNLGGQFSAPIILYTSDGDAYAIDYQIKDLDKDGLNDIVSFEDGKLSWLKGLGNQAFSSPVTIDQNLDFSEILNCSDLTGDGKNDILLKINNPYRIRLFKSEFDSTSFVYGKVAFDQNQNCLQDENIFFQNPQIISFQPGNHFALSFLGNSYGMFLKRGNYITKLETPVQSQFFNLDSICYQNGQMLLVDSIQRRFSKNISLQGTACAFLKLNVLPGSRVPCRTSTTVINISNEGLQTATNVKIRLKLPQFANYKNAFGFPTNSYAFDFTTNEHTWTLQSLQYQTNSTLTVMDSTSCLPELQGLIQCTEASVTYQNGCNPLIPEWDGSDLRPSTVCVPNKIGFKIKNNGSSMADSSRIQIFQNQLLVAERKLKINANQEAYFEMPDAGLPTSMVVSQRPFHPYGQQYSVISDCGTVNALNSFYRNQYFHFPPEKVRVCEVIRTSFDPNDKQVMPLGRGNEGFVENGTRLKYKIRFQNKGTAPAYFVQVRDTLSNFLDVTTIADISSSHQTALRKIEIEGNDQHQVLVFTFPSIFLPDSASNSVWSQGFVSFSIKSKSNLNQLTRIENRASIYFDINSPVVTNVTLNTINDSIPIGPEVILGIKTSHQSKNGISIYPNPVSDGEIQILVKGEFSLDKMDIQMFDLLGSKVKEVKLIDGNLVIKSVPAGVYILKIRSNNTEFFERLIVQ